MSEKVYAWLLRLYPPSFREAFGDDALQLYRDRARDEPGFLSSVRLWLDLLADLAVSIPREYARLSDRRPFETTPAFHVLADESLRRGPLLFGAVFSLLTFGLLPCLISHSGGYSQAIVSVDADPTRPEASGGVNDSNAIDRARVIAGAIANLKAYYIYPGIAQKMADALLAHEKSRDHIAATSGGALASVLTLEMRQVSDDEHLRVAYFQAPIPESPAGPPEAIAQFRKDIATLLGETTGRAAVRITIPHRIDDHFTIFVPSARPINAESKLPTK